MIKLTNLGDLKIWVNPHHIEMIRHPIFSVHGKDCNAVLILSGKEYTVKETPEQVLTLIRGANA